MSTQVYSRESLSSFGRSLGMTVVSFRIVRVTWSAEDNEHVGLCTEFPSLSWLAATPEKALFGIRRVVGEVVAEMAACGEPLPEALAENNYSGS